MTDDDVKAELAALFPHGWAGPDVLGELAPAGWAASPLSRVFHPSAEQQLEEAVRIRRNLADFPRRPDAPPPEPTPEPTLADFDGEYEPGDYHPARECQELVGLCLWDIFSDNHEVRTAAGDHLDLGSLRGGGGFLADVLNAQGGPPPAARPELPPEMTKFLDPPAGSPPEVLAMYAEMRKEMVGDGGYTYLDFYMGTGMVGGRADLGPVYRLIFRRLRGRGLDWAYTFPRLYAVDFRPLKKQMDETERGDEPEWAGYDPSAAFAEEQEDQEHDEKIAELREQLDEGHREAVAEAREQEPPAVVRAYRAVYGRLPAGWPPAA